MGELGIAWNLSLLAAVVLGGLVSWKISRLIYKLIAWVVVAGAAVGVVWYLS